MKEIEIGGYHITEKFIICTVYPVLLGYYNEGGYSEMDIQLRWVDKK